jgi:hypothetical protein
LANVPRSFSRGGANRAALVSGRPGSARRPHRETVGPCAITTVAAARSAALASLGPWAITTVAAARSAALDFP